MKHFTVYLPDGCAAMSTDYLEVAREICSVVLGWVFDNEKGGRV